MVLKWQRKPLFFLSLRYKIGILRGIPLIRSLFDIWGFAVSLLFGVAGFSYVALFLGFWSLGRMSAMSDKLVESRANVIPFHRG